ncbi:MAG: thermonuclease family protein [Betaproteobacteria bacterium]|nr:thermonuclease family protein [Betaproteobacteria bacterium]
MSILAAAAFLCASPQVHDGDSIRCGGERIRIANIDAPELPDSPKCQDRRRSYAWCDFAAGYQARNALRAFLSRGRVTVERMGTDAYGRTLAMVAVNGQDAGEYLISRGLARRWQ